MLKAGKIAERVERAVHWALTGRRSHFSARALSAVAATALLAGALLVVAVPAFAQGWWPFGGNQQEDRGPPTPREPIYRDPPPGGAPPPQGQGGWSSTTKNPICLELEQRLVQEGQRGNESRNMLPMIQSEQRRVEQDYRAAQQQLDRDCYEYFLFSKTLRKTRKCVDLASQAEESRRRLADLETQEQQLSGGRSYQDDIVRELARNRCGPAYEQQARRHDNDDSSIWNDEESSGGGMGGSFGSLPYATYRTVCVRLCDGYYFPISFSTLPNHFERDAEACSSKCAAPAELYYYQNPGGNVDQMTAARTNEQYTHLKTAFRYRKEYVQGCSCKISEFVPEAGSPQQQGAAQPGQVPATGGAPGFLATAPPQSAPQGGQAQRAESAPQPLPWEQR
jgi:hypothetical protein